MNQMEIASLRDLARGDVQRTLADPTIDLNPFSTLDARHDWQAGWNTLGQASNITAATSGRYYLRGKFAREFVDANFETWLKVSLTGFLAEAQTLPAECAGSIKLARFMLALPERKGN